jgi:paraquat-inducible protein A
MDMMPPMIVGHESGVLLACPDCDLLYRQASLPAGMNACCARCHAFLYRDDPGALDRALAWTLAAGVLLAIANVFPVMIFSYAGQSQSNTVVEGVIELARGGLELVALLVFLTSLAFPVLRTAGLLYVLLPLKAGRALPAARTIFRSVSALEKWGMLDVYALAILVTVVKLGQLAEAHIGIGCFALVAAAAAMLATGSALDRRDVWRRLEAAG